MSFSSLARNSLAFRVNSLGKRRVVKERLELAFAYSSRSSSPSKHRYLSQCTWTGFEDRCLFDVAFVTKWVLTQGDVAAHSDGTLTWMGLRTNVSLTWPLSRNGL